MIIYLDLLPPEKKEELKKKKAFLKIIRNEFLFSIPIASLFLILITASFSLNIKSQSANENLSSGNSQKEYQELAAYEEKFNEANSKIAYISKLQKNHLNWLEAFDKINNIVPENVYLTDLSTSNYVFSLAGKAKTRDGFLRLQENIKSESCFSEVKAPLSSLASKEDVVFRIDFSVKEECLKINK
ncbi:MAG: PilN domain-containing protein [Patescibacteria group bacterium]